MSLSPSRETGQNTPVGEIGELVSPPGSLAQGLMDFNRFVEDGALIVGGKGTGKTNLTKLLVSLMPSSWEVKVFDISQAWTNDSPIPARWESNPPLPRVQDASIVYDLGNAYPSQAREAMLDMIRREYECHLSQHVKPITIFVFEEGQMLFKPSSLRSRVNEEGLRLITVGRNQGFSYIVTSQRPQLLDTTVWELCGQRYIGRLFRPRPYFNSILGKDADRLPSLKRGEFLYQMDDRIKLVRPPLFEGNPTILLNRRLRSV